MRRWRRLVITPSEVGISSFLPTALVRELLLGGVSYEWHPNEHEWLPYVSEVRRAEMEEFHTGLMDGEVFNLRDVPRRTARRR